MFVNSRTSVNSVNAGNILPGENSDFTIWEKKGQEEKGNESAL
jgi:hypothetical protein